MISRFVVLGASGDLASRYLLPALARLHGSGALPDDLEILGLAPEDWDDEAFRHHLLRRARALEIADPSAVESLLPRLTYRRVDAGDPGQVRAALGRDGAPIAAYLALPPALFAPAVRALRDAGIPPGSRVVVEKPFGTDLSSAQALNRLLHEVFPEEAVFRVDHFLHKQTVQNILGLRFANRVLEPVWNGLHVERVEIVWDETLTAEGRAGYYDRAGALRDMVQNHLLQLLALVAMEPPRTLSERDLRDRKVEVLRAVERLEPREAARRTVRARYSKGRIGDREVGAYVEEEGVDPERETETFAQVAVRVENWRWSGVPFLLRSGKAMSRDRRFVAVHFRAVPHLAFGEPREPTENVLRLELDPDRLALGMNVNGPGDPFDLERVELDAELSPQELPAYARLLLDVVEGDPALSIRDDEAEESWRIVEPVVASWSSGDVPLLEYPAGEEPLVPFPWHQDS